MKKSLTLIDCNYFIYELIDRVEKNPILSPYQIELRKYLLDFMTAVCKIYEESLPNNEE